MCPVSHSSETSDRIAVTRRRSDASFGKRPATRASRSLAPRLTVERVTSGPLPISACAHGVSALHRERHPDSVPGRHHCTPDRAEGPVLVRVGRATHARAREDAGTRCAVDRLRRSRMQGRLEVEVCPLRRFVAEREGILSETMSKRSWEGSTIASVGVGSLGFRATSRVSSGSSCRRWI